MGLQLMKILDFESLHMESEEILCNVYKSLGHTGVTLGRCADKERVP